MFKENICTQSVALGRCPVAQSGYLSARSFQAASVGRGGQLVLLHQQRLNVWNLSGEICWLLPTDPTLVT